MSLEIACEALIGALTLRVQLQVGRGPLALVGPNGAGKTSLLRVLLGVVPARGRIVIEGVVLLDSARGIDVPAEERRLGYVPQHFALFPHLSSVENVEFAIARGRPGRRARALALLDSLEVAQVAPRLPAALSGGERQRVALARALAAEPRALLLDEPLAALDVGARRQVRDFLATRLRELDLPALVITHDAAEAGALASRIAVLEGGTIVQSGTLAELRAAPATRFVSDFLAR